ncbi:2',5'-phosphodiesterase 12 [Latimeria chalumnae]|uniref:2',5'-phosphodiesterase 12 n=1 Tax=Latimeria chalumnae TaxID=7897 RepID=H3B6R5_LATCH|nr:PREDICTED: 2',5'-phosphodiesterase 12 [Latimeria chalumnae]|eukprot:XP_005997827.1 PREDICTED: 2',5'-phosphodiesterase 12 [Latimeria chalumnae]
MLKVLTVNVLRSFGTARFQTLSVSFCTNTRFLKSPVSRMERAVVRCVPTESKLTISFILEGSQKHMLRDQTEQLGKVLARIANNAVKGQGKAKKSKKNKTEQAVSALEPLVKLYYKEEVVVDDVMNSDAWQDGAVLQIGDTKYKVERNPPTFTTVELPRSIMSGFPVCPTLKIEFGTLKQSVFQWYKETRPNAAKDGVENCWEQVGNERVYTPSNSLVGLKLKLKSIPGNGQRYGAAEEIESSCTVEAGPGTCTFDNRHLYTKKITDESTIRTVTYNILADIYAQTELSKTVLYPYCAPYALELDYRQNLIKKELAGYNADIICLQEVDKNVFMDSLVPAMDAFGLEGLFRVKDKQHEGLATFFRTSKFSLLSQHDIVFSEALVKDPLHTELLEKISVYPAVKEKILQRSTTLQVTVLQCGEDPSRKLCIANTHLYWHPKGGNIRLIQIAISLRHIQHVTAEIYPGTPLIFCGDFNSTPSTGLFEFVTNGNISADHEDWVSNGEEERCNMPLAHFFKLQSACGEPAYTNYVGGFHGCLDYIFTESKDLKVEQVIPLPSHEEVTTHQALPSVSHPSDHIALLCDLKWK